MVNDLQLPNDYESCLLNARVDLLSCGTLELSFYDYYFIEHRSKINIAYNMSILPRDPMFIPPLTIGLSYNCTIVVVGRN